MRAWGYLHVWLPLIYIRARQVPPTPVPSLPGTLHPQPAGATRPRSFLPGGLAPRNGRCHPPPYLPSRGPSIPNRQALSTYLCIFPKSPPRQLVWRWATPGPFDQGAREPPAHVTVLPPLEPQRGQLAWWWAFAPSGAHPPPSLLLHGPPTPGHVTLISAAPGPLPARKGTPRPGDARPGGHMSVRGQGRGPAEKIPVAVSRGAIHKSLPAGQLAQHPAKPRNRPSGRANGSPCGQLAPASARGEGPPRPLGGDLGSQKKEQWSPAGGWPTRYPFPPPPSTRRCRAR
ncbi:hypothetical protein BDV27DRAFT_164927 [Aspergillus caelatus]|uniref:Uncharacterized protein n=1 Tax=Aspergillus caelatus TaxID=61420 RepID=A0A5N6ZJT5_9EURO|nr:uncharacterized protein BDV27DRAFT_164927 [Aspergillus caelatus]KAE8357069.1 hypothetical protein BDV27DRAFT_164927 [Aspergillus caelatus]